MIIIFFINYIEVAKNIEVNIEVMKKYIEVEDLRNKVIFDKIKEILGKINIPISEIPIEVLNEIPQKERPYINQHLESFMLAAIDDKFEICKCIFKTLSFENNQLIFTLNKPFDKFYSE